MITILVAEDDIKLNKLVRAVLENNGYRADMALNGQSAYEMFCEKHYDMIISDIMMPVADGYQLAENIR
ncbi:MAG: response regulator, partial [Clostridia bacterium]|nr:response regulator [Clostridia bacterium]